MTILHHTGCSGTRDSVEPCHDPPAQASPTLVNNRIVVVPLAVPVMRQVDLIELPSTNAPMTCTLSSMPSLFMFQYYMTAQASVEHYIAKHDSYARLDATYVGWGLVWLCETLTGSYGRECRRPR